MTGHVYKKNKKPPDEEIIMAENGSLTSESEHGSEPGRLPLRRRLYRLFHSNRFQVHQFTLPLKGATEGRAGV